MKKIPKRCIALHYYLIILSAKINADLLGKLFVYTYDKMGNITRKNAYVAIPDTGTVTEYQYDSKENYPDRLTKWGNESFEYDNCGNPTFYRGKNLTWVRGRLLKKFGDDITFDYDYTGTRTSKMVGKNSHIYVTENGCLKSEEIIEGDNHYINYFFYDQNGVFGALIKNELYYYVKNLQGDIIEIRRTWDNFPVAKYNYDAWGNHTVFNAFADNIGDLNPFRYRGYYYDTDVKMYYLQTRWYDPEVGRFINLDQIPYLDPETINGLNLYAYCQNNPVMGYDPDGTSFLALLIASIVVCVALTTTTKTIDAISEGKTGWELAGEIIGGVIEGIALGISISLGAGSSLGLISLTGIGATIVSGGIGFVSGFASYSINAGIEGNWNPESALKESVKNGLKNMVASGFAYLGGKAGGYDKFYGMEGTIQKNLASNSGLRWISQAIGETPTKLIYSGFSALCRKIIDFF